MKIYRKIVLQMTPSGFEHVGEDSFEHSGLVSLAKGGGGNNVTTTVMPPDYVVAAQKDLLGKAQGQYGSGASMVAPVNDTQNQAMDMTKALAGNYGSLFDNSSAGAGKNTLGFLLDPSHLDVNSNPYFAGQVNAAVRPITDNFTNNVMPAITNQAISDGGVGGSRQGIAQGLAAGKYMQTVGDVTSNLASSQYNQNLGALLSATNMAPAYANQQMNAAMQPAQLMTGLGDYQRNLQQQQTSEPWQRLDWLRGFVPQSPGSSTTAPGPYSNPLMTALGAGAAGLGLYRGMGGLGSILGGGGAAGGMEAAAGMDQLLPLLAMA